METKTTITMETKERYVLSRDGVRMTYKEWRDMIESERD